MVDTKLPALLVTGLFQVCMRCLNPSDFHDILTIKKFEFAEETMIKIKQLNVEHMHQIVLFDKTCFPTDFWKEEDWKELLEDPRAIYYALLDGDKIVGDVFIYNWKGERDYIKIMNIAVHADYRKLGLAHKLLNHVTAEMTKIGMHRFCGETRASNRAMQRVFEDCGYLLNVIEEEYYDNPNESAYKYVLQI